MAQIDGRSTVKTKSRQRTLGAAGTQKAPRVSTFPMVMARRPAGGDCALACDQAEEKAVLLSRANCFDPETDPGP